MSVLDLCARIAAAWAVATALAWLLRKRSATLRHALWLGVLLVPLVPPIAAGGRTFVGWVAARGGGGEPESRSAPWLVALERAARSGGEASDDASDLAHGAAQRSVDSPTASWEQSIAAAEPLAGWIALLGALLLAGVEARRAWRRRALARRGRLAPAALLRQVEVLAQRLRVAPPPLRLVDAIASPGVIGVLRPLLLLPASLVEPRTARAAAALPEPLRDPLHESPTPRLRPGAPDLEPLLVHELLHLRRRDPWIAALATLVRTLLWFHPCVWHAAARLARERELAVDEAVLLEGAIPAMDYAKSLIEVAAHAVDRRAPRPAVALSSSAQRLRERIERLLRTPAERAASPSQAPRRTDRLTRAAAGALLLAIVACGAASSTQSSGGGAAGGDSLDSTEPAPAGSIPPSGLVDEQGMRAAIAAAGVDVANVEFGGIELARGGAALLIVVRADGTIAAPLPLALPDDGRGFAPPHSLRFRPDGRRDGPPPIEVVLRSGATEGSCSAIIDDVRHAEPAAMTRTLRRALGSTGFQPSLTVYAFGKVRMAALAPWLAELQTRLPELPVAFAGVPSDMNEGPQIHAELAKFDLTQPLAGDVLIAADGRSPSSSVAQVMQAFGARNHGRLAFVARRGEEWVKFSLYLPMDGGVGK